MTSSSDISLLDQLKKAKDLIDCDRENEASKTDPVVQAIEILESLQESIHGVSLFSSNEDLSDLQTSSIPLLSVEYHLAKAYLQLRSTSSLTRHSNVTRAIELFQLFLNRCEEYQGMLQEEALENYHRIQSSLDDESEEEIPELPPQSRDEKISNFKKKRQLQSSIAQLEAKLEQRHRLEVPEHEELDGLDKDGLVRSIYIHQINEAAMDSVSELYSGNLELQMLKMAVKDEKERTEINAYNHLESSEGGASERDKLRPPPQNPNQRMQMKQVLQHPITGELIFKRQELQSSVFRPSWNQPTMTLAELGEKEMKEAIEREARQKLAEAERKYAPRRYEYLARDGLEDNTDLVDASAKLDREWDEWKEQNPRGSGNKMGDRGDRNF